MSKGDLNATQINLLLFFITFPFKVCKYSAFFQKSRVVFEFYLVICTNYLKYNPLGLFNFGKKEFFYNCNFALF